MKRLFCLIVFIVFSFPVYAEYPDGKTCLKRGKDDLEKKKYEDAISSFSRAEKEFPLLGDYALLWLSDVYHETGSHRESLNMLRLLLKKYPQSPLIKKARSREIKEVEEISEDGVRHLFEGYLKDYSGDTEMKYLFAQWLKKNGLHDKAKLVFKDIYVEAGSFSGAAYGELGQSDISVEDMIKRASNLTKLMDYKDAESLLKSAMAKDEGKLETEILKELGQALFKQKRYREAAEMYRKAKDRYWEIRSLYRAGEKDAVSEALDDLLKNGDKKFAPILMTIAADKRREGKPEEALNIYRTLMNRFPSETEDALWGIGWTYFLTGEYQKASEIFDRLYKTFDDPKYLYWKARNLEASGQGEIKNSQIAANKGRGFYSMMLNVKIQGPPDSSGRGEVRRLVKRTTPVKRGQLVYKKIDRVEALLDLGLQEEALSEMVFISKKSGSIEDILYVCTKSKELGEYKLSLRSAAKIPYTEELHDFLYPLAYWEIVQGVSERYAVDPHLILSVVREESRFDPGARSPAGAIGLMQLMPHTALKLDGKLKLGIKGRRDLVDAKKNLNVGAFYLSRLIKEFGSYPYAIAAYNAGEEIVKKWIQRGGYKSADEFIEDIPYNETRNYVKRVLASFFEYKLSSATDENTIEIPFEKL